MAYFTLMLTYFSLPLSYGANEIDFGSGGVYNFPVPVTITQDNEPDIKFSARFDTKPFTPPPYYIIRYLHWNDKKSWGIETVHQKLYLQNNIQDVQKFTITNGYNFFFITRGWQFSVNDRSKKLFLVGLGPIITHPETTVRNKKFDEQGGIPWFDSNGYFLNGISLQIAGEWQHQITQKRFAIFLQPALTAAWARIPIADGHATVPNLSISLKAGLSFFT